MILAVAAPAALTIRESAGAVTLAGQPVAGFVSNRVRALLAYLAVEVDRPHPRETIRSNPASDYSLDVATFAELAVSGWGCWPRGTRVWGEWKGSYAPWLRRWSMWNAPRNAATRRSCTG